MASSALEVKARNDGSVFSPDERGRLRDALVSLAETDERITGAALTGSAAFGSEDRWSDIDLALCVAAGVDPAQVIREWTDRMYQEHGAVHHVDVLWGAVVFRVFLLTNTLQVDLAFWPAAEFGATAPTFQLLFGTTNERPVAPTPSAAELIGMGWLYALHARSSIERGRVWQAEYMVSGVRDRVLALACLRHGVPAGEGRGMDSLPLEITAGLTEALVGSLDIAELRRAFRVAGEALLTEISQVDPELASRLAGPLAELAELPPSLTQRY
ncbi:MAG: nucleotidyltransferase domain-containing protein [Actinomycetota bacterium]|nr:nucleotidyltransferase domain-containing protein [Actinomycetota bacterium]